MSRRPRYWTLAAFAPADGRPGQLGTDRRSRSRRRPRRPAVGRSVARARAPRRPTGRPDEIVLGTDERGRHGRDRRARAVGARADPRRQRRRQDDDAAEDPERADPAGPAGGRDRHEGVAGVRARRWPTRRPRAGARSGSGRPTGPRSLEPARARQRDRAEGQADRDRALHRAALPARRGALHPDRPPGARRRSIPGARRRSRRSWR